MTEGLKHLYIHVPFCSGKCVYCAFYSEPYTGKRAQSWLQAVEREFDLRLREEGTARAAPETLYFGGGTPGMLPPEALARLCEAVLMRTTTENLREWSVEANPGTLDDEGIRILAEAGVNRVSVGVQAFDDAILETLGRRHTAAQAAETLDLLRSGGIDNVGIDLIASLPGVDEAAWGDVLRAATSLNPTHVSVYTLTPEPGTELQRQLQARALRLPDDDSQLQALRNAEGVLGEAGYERYEISNYSKPGMACRHNLACWRGEDYLGIGPAAASRRGRLRRHNAPDLDGYVAALSEDRLPPCEEAELSPEDDVTERLAFTLRMRKGLDLEDFCDRHGRVGAELASSWQKSLEALAQQELVVRHENRWVATPRGWELADTIARELWCG